MMLLTYVNCLNLNSITLTLQINSSLNDLKTAYLSVIHNHLRHHPGAEVHYLNMTALTKGHINSSFWVVDRKHMYIGSAGMDWRSLFMVKNNSTLKCKFINMLLFKSKLIC